MCGFCIVGVDLIISKGCHHRKSLKALYLGTFLKSAYRRLATMVKKQVYYHIIEEIRIIICSTF